MRAPRAAATATGTPHFATLDVLRGAAALAVAIMHFAKQGAGQPFPHGYLAVDLFFLLSGFVVANAYDGRLQAGLGTRRFLLQRFVRLYPLYLLGTLAAIALVFIGLIDGWSWPGLAHASLYGLAMLPVPPWLGGIDDHQTLYPLNDAAWSLLFELLVNLVFVLVHRWLSLRALALWVIAGGIGLIVTVADADSLERGWAWSGFAVGAGRVGFAFPLGVLACRLRRLGRWPRHHLPAWLAVALLALVLAMPAGEEAQQAWQDLAVVLVLLPPLLVFSVDSPAPAKLADWLGEISFPVYMLHGAVLAALMGLAAGRGRAVDALPLWWRALALAALLIVAAPLARRFDAPVRRWLTRRLGLSTANRPPPPSQKPA